MYLCLQLVLGRQKCLTQFRVGRRVGRFPLRTQNDPIATFFIQAAFLRNFGIIGFQDFQSLYSEIRNIGAYMNVQIINVQNVTDSLSVVFGVHNSYNGTIYNASMVGCNISNIYTNAGSLIGLQQNSSVLIVNTTILQTNITGLNAVGGLLGYQYINSVLTVNNSSIVITNIFGIGNGIGGIVGSGYSSGSFKLYNLSLSQIIIKGKVQVGGYCGVLYKDSNILIYNSSITNVNISDQNSAGGVIGWIDSANLTIIDSSVSLVSIVTTSAYNGGVVGNLQKGNIQITNSILKTIKQTFKGSEKGFISSVSGGAKFIITTSSATGIFFNNVVQPDCASLTNTWSNRQCT
ncbi:Conserved_hypothetical protein [Hexamita inflata]|uniref:Uncharacterized protein n=1 Tax=Hexamita inflata TaxID=28002 RepID=A0AA86QLD6_9EUKA|nr:Conserved hypothetical protein [Hexamita inflata]